MSTVAGEGFVWCRVAADFCRADEDMKHEAEQGKKAEKQAVDFFTRCFGSAPR